MKLGIHYANFTYPGGPTAIAPRLAETARVADQAGVSLFSVMDHWFQMEQMGGPPEPMLEGYTTLGYLAAITERLRLSLLVTGATYRRPGLLAKIVTTLDVLSGGRATLGIGAAWYDREHAGLGVPFPPTAERFERLEETLQIVRQMWSDEDGRYEGRHYTLAETVCVPRPLQQPHPPILIGGMGEKKTLRLVAQYAQLCNLFFMPGLEQKLDVLRGHCEAVGRDYDEIEKTVMYPWPETFDADAILADFAKLAALGITHAHSRVPGVETIKPLELIGEQLIPEAAKL